VPTYISPQLGGVAVTLTVGGETTVNGTVERQPVDAASNVTIATPGEIPIIAPVAVRLATVIGAIVHEPIPGAVKKAVSPMQTLSLATVIGGGTGFTVIEVSLLHPKLFV
jgi:hypothetical protein